MKIWGITDMGVLRQQNQDAMFYETLSDHVYLAVVCDGMGGAAAGNIASELAISVFVRFIQENYGAQPVEFLLQQAAQKANEAVLQKAKSDPDCAGMGTTLVAALVAGDVATLVNVGDSRAYYITENAITRVTRDHSLVEDLVERGEITPEEAKIHPQRNLITRALGAEDEVKTDIFSLTMEQGSFLLLCSDGLSNQLDSQEILYEILHGGAVETCCSRLVEIVCHRGAPDNVTAVLLCKGGTDL